MIIPWNSNRGIELLNDSKHKNDFYRLAGYYQPQINPLYCGIATSVIILNAFHSSINKTPNQPLLEVQIPASNGGGIIPFNSYSQHTFLNEGTDTIKKTDIITMKNTGTSIFDPGLTLMQLKNILEVYKLKVDLCYANDRAKINEFKNYLISILNDEDNFLVVNFYGVVLGTGTGGHISPIVAFNEQSSSVLILDVAGHKNSWYWVGIENLFDAMNTKDGQNYRGWLIIKDNNK